MASKPCAACSKVVYPLEMLKCLDQIWHKTCFKCTVCGSILSMKNYKGFEKKPYCNVHYPHPSKFTVVTDTPELQRIAQNAKLSTRGKAQEEVDKSKSDITSFSNATQSGSSVLYTASRADGDTRHINTFADQRLSGVEVVLLAKENHDQTHDNGHNFTELTVQEKLPVENSNIVQETSARTHVAIFDYEAKAEDEVSFKEGDYILNGEAIDEGWMYGTVERSRDYGMLPSNYVEALP